MRILKFSKNKINSIQSDNLIKNTCKVENSVSYKFNELSKKIYETLKPLGYKKDGLNFRLYQDDGLCKIINIQQSQFNSKDSLLFYINIGIYFEKNENISNLKFKVYECLFNKRIINNKTEWNIDETTDVNNLFISVKESFEEVFKIFQELNSKEKTIQLILNNKIDKYFNSKTVRYYYIAKLLVDMGYSKEVYELIKNTDSNNKQLFELANKIKTNI